MIMSCHECEGKVSNEATSCPHCGAPVRKPESLQPNKDRSNDASSPNQTESKALVALVSTFARGIDHVEILPEARKRARELEFGPEVEQFIDEGMVKRVSVWHEFYIKWFKDNCGKTDRPMGEFLADQFFNGDRVEFARCGHMFEIWTECALPKESLSQLLEMATREMVDNGADPDAVREECLSRLSEPRRTIFQSVWDTPERKELRRRIVVDRNVSTPASSSGCIVVGFILSAGLGLAGAAIRCMLC
jgi:hypothetical protein